MKTLLDTTTWSPELYEGNAAFVDVGGTLYVVSQVRPATNSFVVLRSNPVPPDPGPGWGFTQVAEYAFPGLNESFDPVVAYDGSRYIHIIGTQDNRGGYSPPESLSPSQAFPVDLLKFTFDTSLTGSPPVNALAGPSVLATASAVREGYDVCPLSSGSFVAASVVNPVTVDHIPTVCSITGISVSGGTLAVTGTNSFQAGMPVSFSGLQLAQFLNGTTVAVASPGPSGFTASVPYPDYSQPSSPPAYESGFATWLPGNSLLGFQLNGDDTVASVPTALASAPFRSGPVFGSASATCQDGTTVEVCYEGHPKNVSFQDQVFSVNEIVGTVSFSPPGISWGGTGVLTTFTGRYTDDRLTVIPAGSSRLASLVFFTQGTQANTLVGNILVGHTATASPPAWDWKTIAGGALGGSVMQATPSLSLTQGASMSYILSPVYSLRGEWSYADLTIVPQWQDSYAGNDQVAYGNGSYTCILPMRNRGWWSSHASFSPNDISAVPTYYRALDDIPGNPSNLPPSQATRAILETQGIIFTAQARGSIGDAISVGFDTTASGPPVALGGTILVLGGITAAAAVAEFPVTVTLTIDNAPVNVAVTAALAPGSDGSGPVVDALPVNLNAKWEPLSGEAASMFWNPLSGYLAGTAVQVPSYYINVTGAGSVTPPSLDWTNWEPLLPPILDTGHWTVSPSAWPLYTGALDLATLGISGFSTYADLSLTWLRGTKSVLDDKSLWALVGEAGTGPDGSPPMADFPYYVSHFNVPPAVELTPLSASVLRGADNSLLLDASGTYDPDTGDTQQFTWSLQVPVADAPYVSLAPVLDPATGYYDQAILLVERAIGGAEVPVSVAVVAVDYSGVVANHPPMGVLGMGYVQGTNTITVQVDSLTAVTAGEEILLYGLQDAPQFNNAVVTVVSDGALLSPPGLQFTGTVAFPIPTVQGDYGFAADTGHAITKPQYVVVQSALSPPEGFIIPFNPAPVITMPIGIVGQRNSTVTVAPVITGATDPDDLTTYRWDEVSGTALQASGTDTPVLAFETNGAKVEGETITWSLTVNDGVNAPVTAGVGVSIEPYDFTETDMLSLGRSAYWGSIADRNTSPSASPPMEWGTLDVSTISSDLSGVKRTSVLQSLSPPAFGQDRYVVVSPYSVLVYLASSPSIIFRKFLPPQQAASSPPVIPTVLDAVQTEEDYTLMLTSTGVIYRYLPSSDTALNSDNPDVSLVLSAVSSLAFTKMFSTVSYAGNRVLALSGPDGCLLLQVDSGTLAAQAALEISLASQLLYGADNVQFVRLANVESTRSGQVFLGTVDAVGNTYETLVDLSQNAIVGTWDKSKLINQSVTSGEILFEPEDPYGGKPLAPELGTPSDNGPSPFQPSLELVGLSWIQSRPDLCDGYLVQSSIDGGATWQVASAVGSGAVESIVISLARGHSYLFRVQANSADGSSGFSNVENIPI